MIKYISVKVLIWFIKHAPNKYRYSILNAWFEAISQGPLVKHIRAVVRHSRRCPELTSTKAYVDWAVKHQDHIFGDNPAIEAIIRQEGGKT